MSEVLSGILVCSACMGLLFAGVFALGVARLGSVKLALDNPGGQWSLSLTITSILAALPCAAVLLGRLEGSGRFILLVLINLVMQPLCGLMVAAGVHRFIMGLKGRLTYAFRTVPAEGVEPELYRKVCRIRAVTGLVAVVIFGGLAALSLWPLLS